MNTFSTLVLKVAQNSSNRCGFNNMERLSSRSKFPGFVSKFLHFFSDLDLVYNAVLSQGAYSCTSPSA